MDAGARARSARGAPAPGGAAPAPALGVARGVALGIALGLAGLAPAAPAQPPRAGVDLARWAARAESLEADTAAQRRDLRGVERAMWRHALALDPAVAGYCGFAPDGSDATGALSGYTRVVRLGPAERLVLVDCTSGAILANAIVVPYHLRLGGAAGGGTVRRLAVPAYHEGRLSPDDTTLNGMVDADARRRRVEVVNRCCAGREGTTTVYAVTPAGDLALVRQTEWEYDRRGREHVVRRDPPPEPRRRPRDAGRAAALGPGR